MTFSLHGIDFLCALEKRTGFKLKTILITFLEVPFSSVLEAVSHFKNTTLLTLLVHHANRTSACMSAFNSRASRHFLFFSSFFPYYPKNIRERTANGTDDSFVELN